MHNIADLLDAACVAKGGISEYALAKLLGTDNSNVYRWRSGKVMPGIEWLAPLAKVIGIDVQYAIACMMVQGGEGKPVGYWEAEAAKYPDDARRVRYLLEQSAAALERQARQLRKRARGAASILLASGVTLGLLSPTPSEACPLYARVEGGSVYILLNRRRRRISARYRPDIGHEGHGYRPERRRFLSWLNPPPYPALTA